jgi:putative transposase
LYDLCISIVQNEEDRDTTNGPCCRHCQGFEAASLSVRQVKYLNNVVEQDHRAIKRRTRPMLGFKDFNCARDILSGIEVMHMIKKEQVKDFGRIPLPAAQKFYSFI